MEKQKKPNKRSPNILDGLLRGLTRLLEALRLRREARLKSSQAGGEEPVAFPDLIRNDKGLVIALIDRRMSSVVANFKRVLMNPPDRSLEDTIESVTHFFEQEYLEKKDFIREVFLLAPEAGRLETLYKARVEVTIVISDYLQSKPVGFSPLVANQKAFLAVHASLGVMESYVMLAPDYLSSEDISRELKNLLRFILL